MGDPARAPWPWVIRDLPPGWTIEDLQVVAQAALAAFTGFSDNWCAEGSDAALAALHARGHRDVRFCYGGCAVDPTHAYLALQSPDPRWDGAILDPTIRQFIVSPDASVVQRAQVSGYPRCPQVPTVAVVPPWHPFYRRLRYSPDPNVETLADPRDPFFEIGRAHV